MSYLRCWKTEADFDQDADWRQTFAEAHGTCSSWIKELLLDLAIKRDIPVPDLQVLRDRLVQEENEASAKVMSLLRWRNCSRSERPN